MGSRRDWSSCRKRIAFRYCSRDPIITPHYRQWAKSSLSEKLNSLYQSLLKPSARTVLKPPHQKNRTKLFWYFVQFHRNLWKNSIYLCICLHSVREKHQEGVSDYKRDPICERWSEEDVCWYRKGSAVVWNKNYVYKKYAGSMIVWSEYDYKSIRRNYSAGVLNGKNNWVCECQRNENVVRCQESLMVKRNRGGSV